MSCTIWLSVAISFLTWHRLTLRVINNFKGTYSICFGSLQQTERSITTLQNGMPMFCGNTNRLFPQAYGSLVIGFFLEGAHCTVFFGDQVRDGGSNPRRLSSSLGAFTTGLQAHPHNVLAVACNPNYCHSIILSGKEYSTP